jgi:hypothetical protein
MGPLGSMSHVLALFGGGNIHYLSNILALDLSYMPTLRRYILPMSLNIISVVCAFRETTLTKYVLKILIFIVHN